MGTTPGRQPVFTFVDDAGNERAYDLNGMKPKIAALTAHFGDKAAAGSIVGLLFRTGPELVAAWLACLHAGYRPLVMQYPTRKQSRAYWLDSVTNTIERSGLALIVCDAHCAALSVGELIPAVELPDFDTIQSGPETIDSLLPADYAIVQLSSGTTGHRKAIEFRSDDLATHARDFNRTLDLTAERDRIISWLPLYHDMGYVACFVMPIILGIDVVMIDPMTWVQTPGRLFDMVERHRGTICYMPNFGYEVMARADGARPLPSMRWWVSCSEPVSAVTARRFLAKIAADESTFSACYAMAENIFAVTFSRGIKTYPVDGREVVSCGPPIPGVELKIVDEEIWAKSPASLRAYLGGDDIRDADGFYPTGDLGRVVDGELLVTGRKQDLLIQAGRKFMLSDIDLVVNEAYPDVKGRAAAVQVYDDRMGTAKPLVLIESTNFFRRDDGHEIGALIRGRMNIDQLDVAFVPPRFLTKTSSGKFNRKKSAADYLAHRAAIADRGAGAVPSLEDDLKKAFANARWDAPVRQIFDSLSLTILRVILADAGIAYDGDRSLNQYLAIKADDSDAPLSREEDYFYIVSIADRGTLRFLEEKHVAHLSKFLRKPVMVEHLCLPPSPVLLSDLIFQDYFLPRVDGREDYATVERQLNKLRRASLIIADDVSEMQFPPAQVYGVLSHNLERDPRADRITVRWQRYPQYHHKLPVTVVSGADLPLSNSSPTLEAIAAYLGTPMYRIASLSEVRDHTHGWEYDVLAQEKAQRGRIRPSHFVRDLAQWIRDRDVPFRTVPGIPVVTLELSDLAHFCSRIVDDAATGHVLTEYDRFLIIGQESSVPYLDKRLSEMGKFSVRAPSYAPDAIGALAGQYDCMLICGSQGKYPIDTPAVALMAADAHRQTWNMPDDRFDDLNFVVPITRAPVSGQDWYYPFPQERQSSKKVFVELRGASRKTALKRREQTLGRRARRLEARNAVAPDRERN